MSESDLAFVAIPTRTTTADAEARPERLAQHVDEFCEKGMRGDGYPDGTDRRHRRARARFEEILCSLPDLEYEKKDEVSALWKKAKKGEFDYGRCGGTAGPYSAIRDVTEADWPRLRDLIHELCYGAGDLVTRFEAVRNVRGFGPVVITKFLAITQPEHFLPNFVVRSKYKNPEWPGKLDMIELLNERGLLAASTVDEACTLLEVPRSSVDNGDIVVRSNDVLRKSLRPYFTQDDVVDTWGVAQFLYWLARRTQVS